MNHLSLGRSPRCGAAQARGGFGAGGGAPPAPGDRTPGAEACERADPGGSSRRGRAPARLLRRSAARRDHRAAASTYGAIASDLSFQACCDGCRGPLKIRRWCRLRPRRDPARRCDSSASTAAGRRSWSSIKRMRTRRRRPPARSVDDRQESRWRGAAPPHSGAMNSGLPAATGDVVLFLDDDLEQGSDLVAATGRPTTAGPTRSWPDR